MRGIRYFFVRETLGWFRGGYERHMETESYRDVVERLLRLTDKGRVALVCVERNPRGCHTRYISQTLENKGIEVEHTVKIHLERAPAISGEEEDNSIGLLH